MPIRKSRWVWANSIRGGFLRNLSTLDEGGVPYDKKGITLGGQSSIRGFQPDEAFPNKYEFKDESGNQVDPENYKLKESATMYLLKSEIRFPISGSLGGAVFYDGGSVNIKGLNIEDPYRDSFGFAARYVTPVGAASLELGFKLDRKTARRESLANFHLAIGTF